MFGHQAKPGLSYQIFQLLAVWYKNFDFICFVRVSEVEVEVSNGLLGKVKTN